MHFSGDIPEDLLKRIRRGKRRQAPPSLHTALIIGPPKALAKLALVERDDDDDDDDDDEEEDFLSAQRERRADLRDAGLREEMKRQQQREVDLNSHDAELRGREEALAQAQAELAKKK